MRIVVFLIGMLVWLPAANAANHAGIPTASFTNTTVCQGLPTVFTNTSSTQSGSILASIWDFGDGQGSSVFSPQHTYASSGVFFVTLTVINSQGDVDDFSAMVTVHPSGTLNFQISATNNCESSTFTFTNLSNVVAGNFTSYDWEFGDGNTAATPNASHAYATHGSFTITLTTNTNNNCERSFSKVLEVFPEAEVDFSAAAVCTGVETEFSNLTEIPTGLVTYSWSFGDGDQSVETQPEHLYATPGSRNVTLTATTDKGCTTAASKQVTTFPIPTVNFNVADHCFGQTASFANSSTISPGTLTYEWQFGDGVSSTANNPQHNYTAIGNYPVTLTATSDHACETTLVKYVRTSPTPLVDFSFSNVCLGQPATFSNSSTIAEGQMAFQWSFGDAAQSVSANPSHTYSLKGAYTVSLQATSANGGCPVTVMKQIVVADQPQALFQMKDNCLDSTFQFKNMSVFSETGITYTWSFGDGQTFQGVDAVHQYAFAQTYTVSLSAEADNGCSDVETKTLKVAPVPQVNFSADNVCFGAPTKFQNFSSISAGTVTYQWNFGDNNTSSGVNPEHAYSNAASFEVSLKGTTSFGCSAVVSKTVTVNALPVTDFNAPAVCDGNVMRFTNLSSIQRGSIASFQWDFGDETTSIIKNPSKEFFNDGEYTVKLSSFSDRGCETSIARKVTVYPLPVANFAVSDVCSREAISVDNTSTISSGSLTYQWNFGDMTTSVATSPSHNYNSFGVYTISLLAISDKACRDSVSRAVAIFSLPEINAGEDVLVSQGYPTELFAQGGVTYRWEPVEGLSNSSIANPVATPLITTDYVVFGKNSYGCESSDTVRVSVENEFKLVAANILTPDDNGSNDTWVIENVETFGDVNVRVYDRTGRLVFRQQAYQNDWRGTTGKDILPDGTYYYYITFGSTDKVYKGALTIIRNRN